MDWKDQAVAAQGYLELGMPRDAWNALEKLPPNDQVRLEVTVMRLAILQRMENWETGAEIARDAIQTFPDSGDFYLLGAYCIRRAEDLETAFEFLTRGESHLETEPCYWFNIGCYHCQLGRLDEAKDAVEKAIDLDGKYQAMAMDDEDLAPLRDELG